MTPSGAVADTVVIAILFAALGPLIAAFAMVGIIGVLLYPGTLAFTYLFGTLPAAAVGAFVASAWRGRRRSVPATPVAIDTSGVTTVTLTFLALAPLICAITVMGVAGVVLAPASLLFAYVIGAVPAAIAGFAHGQMWRAGVAPRWRFVATIAIGAIAGAAVLALVSVDRAFSAWVGAGAGAVAAITLCWVVDRLIRSRRTP